MNLIISLVVLAGFVAATLYLYHAGHLPGTLPYWMKQLKDPSKQTRLRTVLQLAQIATPQAAFCLSQVALDEQAEIKQMAIKGLLAIRDPSTLKVIVTASADRDPKIRRMVAEGLWGIPEASTEVLADMLKDPDETVVAAAAESLGKRKDPSATVALVQAIGTGEETARLASQALLDIGPAAVESIVPVLPTLAPITAERLIPVLMNLDPRGAFAPLVELLNTTDNQCLILAIIPAIVGLRSREAADAIIAYIEDERHQCRPFALGQLQALEDPAVNALLIRLIQDQDVMIRRAAAEAVCAGHNSEWVEALLAALGDAEQTVFQRVAEALGKYEDPRILPELIATLWPADYEDIIRMVEDALRMPLAQVRSADEFFPVLQRISSREARGSEEQRIRHHLQSLLILLRPGMVCGFHDLTNTILVFKGQDFVSEYQEKRLHPTAAKALRMQSSMKALHLWKTSLR